MTAVATRRPDVAWGPIQQAARRHRDETYYDEGDITAPRFTEHEALILTKGQR